LPAGVVTELIRMNPGQVSANLVEGGDLVVVQLCNRRLVPDPRPGREQVRQMLFNRALEQRAEVYLQTLRAEAEIRRN
jgi:parvulin-like peptidyl-prolyl isomerase